MNVTDVGTNVWSSVPILPPLDEELLRLIDDTALKVLLGTASMPALMATYGNHPLYSFLKPSNEYLHNYFNWAIQCKRVNIHSDPGDMARIAIKPPLIIPPRHPKPTKECNTLNANEKAVIEMTLSTRSV